MKSDAKRFTNYVFCWYKGRDFKADNLIKGTYEHTIAKLIAENDPVPINKQPILDF